LTGGVTETAMNLLIPFDASDRACLALGEACRMATPLDRVFAMAAVLVPAHLPADVTAGEIWAATCSAEVSLSQARAYAERVAHYGDDLRCVRVQARTWMEAVLAGAIAYAADTILLAEPADMRGRIATLFGMTHRLLRRAPCDVRVLYLAGGRQRRSAADGGQRSVPLSEVDSLYEGHTATGRPI
jgi:hypothetical protein